MMRRLKSARSILGLCMILALPMLASHVSAHAGHDHRLKVLSLPGQVHLEVTLTAEELSAFSAAGETFRSDDLAASRSRLEAWLDAALVLRSSTSLAVAPYFRDLVLTQDTSGRTGIKVRQRYHCDDAAALEAALPASRSWLLIKGHVVETGSLQPGATTVLELPQVQTASASQGAH